MSDYMKEAERLSRVLEDIAQTALRGVDNEQIRGHLMDASALLAHFQRGAVPEDERAAFESWIENEAGAGAARRWLNTEAYENGRVQDYRTGWIACLEWLAAPAPDHFRGVTKMVPAPAEVPMPEPDTHCYDEDERRDVWSHSADQMRTYGDACRAAGEAAGYARGLEVRLSPEKMRIAAAGWREFDFVEGLAGEAAMIDRICSAIYAALRREVKP